MPKCTTPKLPDYEKEYKKKLKEEIAKVRPLLMNKDKKAIEKVEKFCKKYEKDYSYVLDRILDEDEDIVYLFFAKDPKKQNIYENLAAEYIKELSLVSNFKGASEIDIIVSKGKIVPRKKGQSLAKTIDFQWECRNKTFYGYHKYTLEEGGAQGSQYKDLQSFIIESKKSKDTYKYFIAIADGKFYSATDSNEGMTRLNTLKKKAKNNPRVHAVTIEELRELLIQLCE